MSYQQPKLRRWPWENDQEYEYRRSHLTLVKWLWPRLAAWFIGTVATLIVIYSPIPVLALGIFFASLLFCALVGCGMKMLSDSL